MPLERIAGLFEVEVRRLALLVAERTVLMISNPSEEINVRLDRIAKLIGLHLSRAPGLEEAAAWEVAALAASVEFEPKFEAAFEDGGYDALRAYIRGLETTSAVPGSAPGADFMDVSVILPATSHFACLRVCLLATVVRLRPRIFCFLCFSLSPPLGQRCQQRFAPP